MQPRFTARVRTEGATVSSLLNAESGGNMRLDGNRVTLETKECSCTWRGTPGLVAKQVPCPVCKGTGRGIRGGRDGCRKCHGFKWTYSDTENVTCSACNGTAIVPENSCDTMPDEMYLGLPFKVYRHNRELTYGENLLGWGCVYSCTDYGRAYCRRSFSQSRATVQGCQESGTL